MNEVVAIQIRGVDEVRKALEGLPIKIAQKVLRRGVAVGANLLSRSIRKNAPVRATGGQMRISSSKKNTATRAPGFLKKNVKGVYRRRVSKQGDVHYKVGPTGNAWYGYIVETGHVIGKKKRYGLGISKQNSSMMRVPEHPFIMPVFNTMQVQVINTMKDKMTEGIEKEARGLGLKVK